MEALPGWSWDPNADDWAAGLAALRSFAAREGNLHVPFDHIEGDLKLGHWIVKRRFDYTSGRLDPARAAELEKVAGWSWDPRTDSWATGLAAVRTFVAREGHARVPTYHVEDGLRLGSWVGSRRQDHKRRRLGRARAAALEALPGWTWDKFEGDWRAGLEALHEFVAHQGHAHVPKDHIEGDLRLGEWVNSRRVEYRRGSLDPSRVTELEALPGWTWDPAGDRWPSAMTALRAYAAREGHTRVPQQHVEGHVRLGAWVNSRRADHRRGALDPVRCAELEALPGWTWEPRTNRWKTGLDALRAFVAREGHARVPGSHVEGDFRLGRWISKQRAYHKAGRMDSARAAELEALHGWTWGAGSKT